MQILVVLRPVSPHIGPGMSHTHTHMPDGGEKKLG